MKTKRCFYCKRPFPKSEIREVIMRSGVKKICKECGDSRVKSGKLKWQGDESETDSGVTENGVTDE